MPIRTPWTAALAAVLLAAPASAQEWPSRQPIRVIVPLTAGSSTDIVGRTVFEQVGKQIGQSFVFENRGGGGTTIGTGAVATAEPDGYTILVASGSIAVIPTTHTKLNFSVTGDLAGISPLADVPFTVSVPPRHKSMKDFITYAKGKPTGINFGSAGNGTAGHLFMAWLALQAGYPGVHVPFRGTPEGMNEVVADRLDVYPAPVVSGVELAAGGKISILAVSSMKRAPLLPNVPTLAELGLEKATYGFWIASFTQRKTPKPILDRLNREVVAALNVKEVAEKIVALGGAPMPMSPAETDEFMKKEIAVNAEIIKAAKITFGP
jgi:tripartite-type tricarboxylate transporter receptor subunit TctC